MMNDIIRFFQNVADDCELVCFNQDLVGFFTSIPVPRIVAAVDWMLQQFMLKYDTDPAKYTFSVSLREKDSKLRVWKGKSRSAGTRMYQIWFQDILPIVRIACDSSYFTVLGRVFAQQRGAAIGNQISPVLASISVAHLAYAIEMIMTKDRPTLYGRTVSSVSPGRPSPGNWAVLASAGVVTLRRRFQAWCSARGSGSHMRMWVSGALVATNSCAVLLIKVVQVPGIPWQAALDILCKVREDRLQEDATLLATVAGANAKRASCPNTPIPKTGKYVKPHLKEVYKFFRDEWVNCNVFRLDSSGDVGPLSERPITLLADYFSVDELKQIVQPRAQPAPLVMCKEPLVVRDVRLRENLSLLEQERLNYEPALPGYLRDRVTWQEDELAPHSCDNIEELVQSFPLIHSHVCAIRLVPPIAAEGDEVETLISERSPTSTMRQTAAPSDCGKPMTVGIVFASSQVPGYHPVIAGLFDYLDGLPGPAKLIGFFCGYEGLLKDLWAPITKDMVDQFRNLGGTGSACWEVVGSWAAAHALSMPMLPCSTWPDRGRA
eukprot:s1228_g4.t1